MAHVLLWILMALSSPESRTPSPESQSVTVRLHHVHYRVGDPSAAMAEAAFRLEGSRAIVSGLGVGVRTGSEFVLYDRLDDRYPPEPVQQDMAAAYDAAIRWLLAHGLNAAPERWTMSRLSRAPAARFEHIAFAATDYDRAISQVNESPMVSTTESMIFDAGGGLLVEIVRDANLPDAYWCPMHPDIRSGTAGRCPVCSMELVPMPAPAAGEYKLDVEVLKGPRGATGVRLAVRAPSSNALVTAFRVVHEKLLHLFIVSRDLDYFDHVHPDQQGDGTFLVVRDIPPGEHMLIADFLPTAATSQMVQRAVIVPGRGRSSPMRFDDGGLRVEMKAERLAAGREGRLTFTVTDAASGQPVTDLEPYLGAPAHMLIVRSDLSDAFHEHPEEQVSGPAISFHPLIPAAGDYKLWIQFKRKGRVSTFSFPLRAE